MADLVRTRFVSGVVGLAVYVLTAEEQWIHRVAATSVDANMPASTSRHCQTVLE